MKKTLTTTCGAAFVLALTLAGAKAQIYTNALDTTNGWGPGGDASVKSWDVVTDIVAPGSTASWRITGTFTGPSRVDIYTLPAFGTWDFSTNTFSIYFRSSSNNAPMQWQLGNASNNYYSATLTPTAANTWEKFTLDATNFTADVANLTNITSMQLKFVGDGIAPGEGTFYVDQMNIVPEPSAAALLALGAAGVGALAWRKRRRALS